MRLLLNVVLLLFVTEGSFAQAWLKLYSIPAKGNSITTDNLGNAYVIEGDEMTKYLETGSKYRVFSNKRLGKISAVDALNPLKIVVFYRDFSKVVFLDNTITENGMPLNLADRDLEFASIICASFDNGIWVYDPVRFLLLRLNQNLQETVRITNLNQILGYSPQPMFMTEYDNRLFMSDPDRGILMFDIFGTYLSTIRLPEIGKFQVTEQQIYFPHEQSKLIAYGLKSLRLDSISLPVADFKDMRWWKDRAYILKNDSLHVYRYTPSP